jgi:hypothetical protein
MRICLSLLCWIAITVWCTPAVASAMANCHTHQSSAVADPVLQQTPLQPQLQVQIVQSVNKLPSTPIQESLLLGDLKALAGSLNRGSHQDLTSHVQPDMASHDCCDEVIDHHSCSDNCLNCDGCTTAHHGVMPTSDLPKNLINQQKIQFSVYTYQSLQRPTQERPPKH